MVRSKGEYVDCQCEAPKPGTAPGDFPCICMEPKFFPKGEKIPDVVLCPSCAGNRHRWRL